tara:strand:+ start:159 stop:1094 length:936 start_codon:yes stop_codon:yes gene_type:complete
MLDGEMKRDITTSLLWPDLRMLDGEMKRDITTSTLLEEAKESGYNRLHMICFVNAARKYVGGHVTSTDLRKFLCTKKGGLKDMADAGMVVIKGKERDSKATVKHYILNQKQLKRVLKCYGLESAEQLKTSVLEKLNYQVGHLLNFPGHDEGDAFDNIINYALVPQWLNQSTCFKDCFGRQKQAYVGTTGTEMVDLFYATLVNRWSSNIHVIEHMLLLFRYPDSCDREWILTSIFKLVGDTSDGTDSEAEEEHARWKDGVRDAICKFKTHDKQDRKRKLKEVDRGIHEFVSSKVTRPLVQLRLQQGSAYMRQ